MPPTATIDHVPFETGAGVRLVASNDTRCERLCMLDVTKSDIGDCDERLRLTGRKRVKHTTRSRAIRLLLLLRTDVDGPPNSTFRIDVFIGNTSDFTA